MPYYDLLKKLGFTFTSNVVPGAAYIMPDGKFLDITSSMKVIDPSQTITSGTHPALDDFLIENGYLEDNGRISRVLCSSDNAIRVNDGSNFRGELIIGLPPQRPSEAQFKSLENWLYHIFSKGGVDVGNDNSSNIFKHYDFNKYLPEEVIKKIKMYYGTGQLRDCKVD